MAANLINEDFAAPVLDTRYRIGAWVAVASIAMLFTALSSAYVVRAASASDWQPLAVPRVLWLSTLVLVASSGAIEMARRNLRHSLAGQFSRWLTLTGLLAIGFLALQFMAWKQ